MMNIRRKVKCFCGKYVFLLEIGLDCVIFAGEKRGKRRIPENMGTEKSSEKMALYVALVASILALALSIFTYLAPSSGVPSKPGPGAAAPSRRPPGGGGMMRGFAPSPEYIRKYEERVQILKRLHDETQARFNAAGCKMGDVYQRLFQWDEGRLNLMRLKNGRRAVSAFADAYLAVKNAAVQLSLIEEEHKAGAAPLDAVDDARLKLNEAELHLLEVERRADKEKVAEAKAAVGSYPAKLTEEQLEKLLAAEQRSRGPR